MKRSRRAMRRLVLSRMYDLLDITYDIGMNREEFIGEWASVHEIEAVLAFRSDPRLDELRGALERIDDGSYGVCLGCKTEIDRRLLEDEPARRLCEKCEKAYSRSSSLSMEAHSVQ